MARSGFQYSIAVQRPPDRLVQAFIIGKNLLGVFNATVFRG